ncbi:glycosyl hydrolase 115 family protein, partial [Stenotrophomonas geniculata]|uniref:glycosyl hydrolase 115 family protein n=1 Tax=Stenotrophomonas geniculata TaxID=86188 RepID=UPI000B0EC2F6
RRGVVFGLYDLSEKIGVSPWSWWADVPVQPRRTLYLTAGEHRDQPKVKYRGFFINDENPAFDTWARTHFGGINAQMYAHVFDLLLRLKGNYLWPAMWAPKAFNDDDPQNMVLADAVGVVMGTSHHEPMMRAHDEWHRHQDGGITGGAWDYLHNGANLRAFWRGGIERMVARGLDRPYDSVVTIGMRGDGDEALTEGTAITLLERVVADQRAIIGAVTGKPAAQTPQVWALYK